MSSFSKFKDIEAVMTKAGGVLPVIEREYLKCLKEKKIPEYLLVEVKDCLSNLRTALDYLWNKIPSVSSGHFPVANSKADFLTKVERVEEKYATVLKKYQNYDSNSWIRCFNLFRNKNVHLTLIPQKRTETKEFSVKKMGAAENTATFRGCTFGGNGNHIFMHGVPLPIDLKTQFPLDTPGLDIDRKIWVDFLFDGSSISREFPERVSALPFLKESFKTVSQIILDLEKEIE